MTQADYREGLQLQSTVTKAGQLEISLATVETPSPGPDDIVIRIEGSPINPSDLGLLFGPADMQQATSGGSADRPVITAPVPAALMKMVTARLDQSMPVGNEGAGIVVDAGTSDGAQALIGKTVAAIGGARFDRPRGVRAMKPS